MSEPQNPNFKVVSENRKARFDYEIIDKFEAGIVLTGTEVKSLRAGLVNISDAHAQAYEGEIILYNMNISEYSGGNRFNHDPRRPRKLLLHKKQIKKMIGQVKTKGISLVPLTLYFNHKGLAKVSIAIVKGKKSYEKRDSIKDREWQRDKERLFKNKG